MSDFELAVVSPDSFETPNIIAHAGPSTRKKYAADRHGRRLELLESEHRPDSPFYPAMVLLDDIV